MSTKAERRARRDARRQPEPQTEPTQALHTAYDARTITFAGVSAPGLPDADITAAQQPPAPAVPAGYAATTGPLRAIGRPAITIGDALTRDDRYGPLLTPLPCTHCGEPPPVPAGILERTRIIGHVNWLAWQAGWRFGYDWDWTCPPCQQTDAWKARQGQMELRWPDDGACPRHDYDGRVSAQCTCPDAVLAVDVMLRSEDYLGSGRGRHRAATR